MQRESGRERKKRQPDCSDCRFGANDGVVAIARYGVMVVLRLTPENVAYARTLM